MKTSIKNTEGSYGKAVAMLLKSRCRVRIINIKETPLDFGENLKIFYRSCRPDMAEILKAMDEW